MARDTQGRAAALQRSLPLLGRKSLAARAGVTERTVRRWADGTRAPSKANQQRIDRLFRELRPDIDQLSRRTAGVRERVSPSGDLVRTVGRRRLPDVPIETLAARAGELRGVDDQLAGLGSEALLAKLAEDGITSPPFDMVLATNGEEDGTPVPFFVRGFPSISNGVTAYFLVQEYRRGAREMFVDKTLIPPPSPSFSGPANAAGLGQAGPSGERRIDTPSQARAFGDELASTIREAYTRIGEDEIIVGPSALVSRGSLQGFN